MSYLRGAVCAVYGGKHKDNLLLVVPHKLWVINGDWQLEKRGDIFLHPLTKKPIDIRLLGYIDYDGDYNKTLTRFENGEGTHISALAKKLELKWKLDKPTPIVSEFCKKQYYGISCSCSKCER